MIGFMLLSLCHLNQSRGQLAGKQEASSATHCIHQRTMHNVLQAVVCLWKLIVQVSVVLRKTAGGSD